jgi:hypothetical protein
VIVRIFSDGQYRVPDDVHDRLHELDNKTVSAVDAGDEAVFKSTYKELVELIHANGERLADDDLTPSDLMLPPADISLEEARSEFTGEGLLPD